MVAIHVRDLLTTSIVVRIIVLWELLIALLTVKSLLVLVAVVLILVLYKVRGCRDGLVAGSHIVLVCTLTLLDLCGQEALTETEIDIMVLRACLRVSLKGIPSTI